MESANVYEHQYQLQPQLVHSFLSASSYSPSSTAHHHDQWNPIIVLDGDDQYEYNFNLNRYMNEILPNSSSNSRDQLWAKNSNNLISTLQDIKFGEHDSGSYNHDEHPSRSSYIMKNNSKQLQAAAHDVIDLNQNLWASPGSFTIGGPGSNCDTNFARFSADHNNNTNNLCIGSLLLGANLQSFEERCEGASLAYCQLQQSSCESPSNSSNKTSNSFRINEVSAARTKKFPSAPRTHHETMSPSREVIAKKIRVVSQSSSSSCPTPTLKVRKEKLGDRIAALHRLVSPFGRTDTASVLTEAIGYIQFLQDQIQTLSMSYVKSSRSESCRTTTRARQDLSMKDQGTEDQPTQDLRSRGLCLVPLTFTSYLCS